MKKWLKDLTALAGSNQLVRIKMKPEIDNNFDGYIIGVSESFVMLHVLCGEMMVLNGYMVVRTADVHHYYVRDESEWFHNRTLKLKNISPVPQPEISLADYTSLLTTANERFPLLTIHQELKYPDVCSIGKIAKLTKKKITLQEIDANAEWWRGRPLKLKHITRIDFGDGYAEALDLVSTHEAASSVGEPRA